MEVFQGVNKLFQVMWSICSNSPVLNGKLPIPEISRFEIILASISDIYEFFKSITLFKNSMGKSWLLVTKLGPCVALGHHLHPE